MEPERHIPFRRNHKIERRTAARLALRFDAELEHQGVRIPGRVEDVSDVGACFVTKVLESVVHERAAVHVTIHTGAEAVGLRASVAWVDDVVSLGRDALMMGLVFDEPLRTLVLPPKRPR